MAHFPLAVDQSAWPSAIRNTGRQAGMGTLGPRRPSDTDRQRNQGVVRGPLGLYVLPQDWESAQSGNNLEIFPLEWPTHFSLVKFEFHIVDLK